MTLGRGCISTPPAGNQLSPVGRDDATQGVCARAPDVRKGASIEAAAHGSEAHRALAALGGRKTDGLTPTQAPVVALVRTVHREVPHG